MAKRELSLDVIFSPNHRAAFEWFCFVKQLTVSNVRFDNCRSELTYKPHHNRIEIAHPVHFQLVVLEVWVVFGFMRHPQGNGRFESFSLISWRYAEYDAKRLVIRFTKYMPQEL